MHNMSCQKVQSTINHYSVPFLEEWAQGHTKGRNPWCAETESLKDDEFLQSACCEPNVRRTQPTRPTMSLWCILALKQLMRGVNLILRPLLV